MTLYSLNMCSKPKFNPNPQKAPPRSPTCSSSAPPPPPVFTLIPGFKIKGVIHYEKSGIATTSPLVQEVLKRAIPGHIQQALDESRVITRDVFLEAVEATARLQSRLASAPAAAVLSSGDSDQQDAFDYADEQDAALDLATTRFSRDVHPRPAYQRLAPSTHSERKTLAASGMAPDAAPSVPGQSKKSSIACQYCLRTKGRVVRHLTQN